jgi:hypothetical protein
MALYRFRQLGCTAIESDSAVTALSGRECRQWLAKVRRARSARAPTAHAYAFESPVELDRTLGLALVDLVVGGHSDLPE